MKLFAISDLHLSGADPKPMEIFGGNWEGHWQKIRENWRRMEIGEEDVVLIPGDISWAMQLEGAQIDLDEIGELPGHKIIMRGNHDYWWNSLTKVRAALPESSMPFRTTPCASVRWWCAAPAGGSAPARRISSRRTKRSTAAR